MTLVLSDEDLAHCLTLNDAMAGVEAVLEERRRQTAVAVRRLQLRLTPAPHPGSHPTARGPGAGLESASCGLAAAGVTGLVATPLGSSPTQAVTAVWSDAGQLLAVICGQRLWQLCAGATAAVAAQRMARDDAEAVGVLGSGRLARAQLAGLHAVRPVRQVRVWAPDAAPLPQIASRWSHELGVPVGVVPSPRAAVAETSLVIAATGAASPVIAVEWLRPGVHISCATPLYRGHTELGSDIIEMADLLVCDYPEQPTGEATFLLQGTPHLGRITDLATLAATPPRRERSAITLFLWADLPHISLELARQAYQRALARGIGRHVPDQGSS